MRLKKMFVWSIMAVVLATAFSGINLGKGYELYAASITLSKYSGPPGIKIWVNGTGFDPSTDVGIFWDIIAGGTILNNTTTDSNGDFSAQITIPQSPAGVHTIIARDVNGNQATASFTVVPAIYINPSQGIVGTSVDVYGNGFSANTWVYLYWDSTYLGRVRTDGVGTFNNIFTFNVPESPYGTHTITAFDGNNNRATATFLVLSNLVLSRQSGSYYTTVDFQCTGYSANKPIYIIWDMGTSYQQILASGYTNGAGSFSGSFRVPESPYGWHTVTGIDADTHADTENFFVYPKLYAFPGSGVVGDWFYLIGYGYSANALVNVYWDYSEYIGNSPTNINGTFVGIFRIPYTTVGTHIIYAEDTNNANTTTTYSINPSVSVHPNHGLAGITAEVNCTGFSGNTGIRIYWDYGTPNQQLLDTGTTDATGSYNTTVTIPNDTNGSHSIVAIDNNNYVAQTTFYLGPNILLNPDYGYVGTNVTVQGYTFSPNVNVNIYWDNVLITTTTTNSTGDFLTYIIVPSSFYGYHEVKAVDANGNTASAQFFVLASITLSSYRGYVFDNITIHGTGFSANSASYIYWDGTNTMRSMLTDANGEFTLTFQIPEDVAGYHTIYAEDLNGVRSNDTYFDIMPSIKLVPAEGYVGGSYKVYCYGFAGDSILTLLWDGNSQPYTTKSNAKGSGVIDAVVPNTTIGNHNVEVYDESLNFGGPEIFTVLAVDSPTALEPSGFVNTTSPTLIWTSVDYAVEYELQYDTDPSFSSPITVTHIVDTQYALSGLSDATTYYWRVRGVDSAGNKGTYSNILSFTVDITPPQSKASVVSTYVNDPHITIYFNASDSTSGVKKVALYYSYEGLDYLYYGEINATNGVFDFYATHGDGRYYFYTVAYDNAGNIESLPADADCSVLLDTTTPIAYIVPLPEYMTTRTFNISYVAMDNGSGIRYVDIYYSNDLSTWIYYGRYTTSPVTFFAPHDGIFYFQAIAKDYAGNVESLGNAEAYTTVDTIAPQAQIIIDGNIGLNGWYTSNVKISFTADSDAEVYYSIDGGNWTKYQAEFMLSDGVYNISYYAKDSAGNVGSTNYAIVKVDTHKPALSLISPENNEVVNDTILIEANSSDAMSSVTVEYKIDNGGWTAMSVSGSMWNANVDTTALSDGIHTISVRSMDEAGNTAMISVTVIVDNNPPQVYISAPLEGEYIGGMYVVKVYAYDSVGVDRVVMNIDGIGYEMSYNSQSGYWEYNIDTTLLGEGSHSINATAWDKKGNSYTTSTTNFYVDNIPPSLSILYPENNEIVGGVVTLQVTSEDVNSVSVYYRVDNGEWNIMNGSSPNWNASLNTNMYEDGQHTIYFKAVDAAGHEVMVSVKVIVDNNAPYGYVEEPDTLSYLEGTFVFRVYAYDSVGVDRVEIYIDSTSYNMISAGTYYILNVDTHTLGDGNHSVYAVIYDESGKSYTTDTVNFYVDNNAPYLAILSPYDMEVLSGEVNIEVDVSDVFLATVEYSVDNTGYVPITTSLNTTMYEDGLHKITVRAIDKAGHITERSVMVYIDNTPPSIVEVSLPKGIVSGRLHIQAKVGDVVGISEVYAVIKKGNESVATYNLAYNSATGYYELYLDSSQFNDGAYTIEIYGEDLSGKQSMAKSTFTVDNTAPTIKYSGEYVFHKSTTLEFSVSDSATEVKEVWISIDGGEWIPMELSGNTAKYKWNLDLKDNGVHSIKIKAVDSAGNEVTKEFTIYVDVPNYAPIIYIVILAVLIFLIWYLLLKRPKPSLPVTEEKEIPQEEEEMEEPSEEFEEAEETMEITEPKEGGEEE